MKDLRHNHTIYLGVLLSASMFFLTGVASIFAQIENPFASNDIQITFSPRYPEPHQTVRANAQSFSFNMSVTEITWLIDGKVVDSGIGATSITFETGSIGSRTVVSVSAAANGRSYDNSVAVYPSTADLIWSAYTQTPAGYRGKPLPSRGALVQFTAIPNLSLGKGRISPANLFYEWWLDNKPLREHSGKGKDTLFTRTESSSNIEHTVRVIISDAEKQVVQEQVSRVRAYDPQVRFYEIDPLRGPHYERAINRDFLIPSGQSRQVLAFPYFIATPPSLLSNVWRVAGDTIPSNTTNPSILNYSSELGSFARQHIEFEIENPNYIYERARGSFLMLVQ